ncbi:hypothetical protein B296_00038517 [Ensete ventricosum]|uniref:transketolase n=1 Tax=Ensete ventricosum TaxID=4639 RepID=A0A426YKK1_ENSVE|nr:hypothetical protein B296_00038517 [Ensete ventricosum]
MAVSSLVFPCVPLCSTVSSLVLHPLSARKLRARRLRAQIHLPEDYRLSWVDELKRSPNGPVPREKLEEDDDDDFFQSSVDRRAVDNVRMLIVDAVQHAQAGHPGMALGMADVAYHLYRHVMRYNPENPRWFNRDRFVLSAGHGCLLQYVCLHLAGFESVQLEDLKRLCKLGSRTPGHPENAVTAGVEVTTGPLGQGVANAVGLALAEAHLAARFNKPDAVLVDHRTYCIMGDGDAMEGISNEAASLAAHWKLNKLTLIYDDNHNTIDGDTNLAFSEDVSARFEALGWNTITLDFMDINQKWSTSDPVDATRGYSARCLNALVKVLPGLIGGSADLASSNKVYLEGYDDFRLPASPWGRNIRYGVREHAMAGISNGIALHGSGLIPFAATFLTFSDYMKNSIRLSALSHAGVVYVFTHDSIGLGEDGPTHQPVEQLAGLRAIPRMLVFRPADGNEIAGAYMAAIANRTVPSAMALSRQKVAANLEGSSASDVARGGYVISDNSGDGVPEIILIGTGSELCLCEGSAGALRKEGRRVRVISLVCWRLFDVQPREYKESVLPPRAKKRVSVEAGSPIGWREYVGEEGIVHGVDDFGCSGAYLDAFRKYGFTEENITRIARSLIDQK